MLHLFTKPTFDDNIVREEIHTYHPHTKSFNYNDEIEITINQKDTLMAMYDSLLFLEGKLKIQSTSSASATSTPAALPSASTLLTNNYGSFLFDSMTYELNGKEIEKIRDPGIVSTIRAYLCFNEDESKSYQIAGFNWPFGKPCTVNDTSFALYLPLKFYFGVLQDYKKVIAGKHTIKLVRARSDVNCYKEANNGKLEIELTRVELKVKHVYPSDKIRLQLYDQFKNDKPIFLPYRKWELHELPTLSKSTKEVWAVKTSTNLERPRFVIVAFQQNRDKLSSFDSTTFNHLNLINIKAYLNSETYPYEPIKCDFNKNQFIEAYQNYCDFQKLFYGKLYGKPLMDYELFKDRSLFVIDCSKQNESLKQTTIDLKLEFESSTQFPDNTRAYCIIIHDCLIEYKPLTETIRNVI